VDNTNQKKLFGTLVLNKFYFPLMALIIFMSYGCAQYGPNHIKSERSSYNQAIQKTNNEQLILNLVRLKYRDNPLFMEVSNLASQFTIQNKIGLTTKLQAEATGVFTPNSDVYIEERPTISYSPLHGESFVKGVLTAVSLKSVVLLFNSGWSIERIFKLCIQRLNNLKNAPSASGPTPKIAPNTDQFFTAVRFLPAQLMRLLAQQILCLVHRVQIRHSQWRLLPGHYWVSCFIFHRALKYQIRIY
jgi:hypothetical protein